LALLIYWPVQPEELAGAPLILIELAPVPVAPVAAPSAAPPGPEQPQAAASASEHPPPAEPEKTVEPQKPPEATASISETPKPAPAAADALPQPPQAEQTIAVLPPPKPAQQARHRERPQSRAQIASAPSAVPHRAQRAAAPAPGASAGNPAAMSNWKSQLLARLERSKRYPPDAQARGEHGIAQLAFSVDRAGGVHGAHIARSSGSQALDRATLELVERAQPLPPPPAGTPGNRIAIVVPIRYSMH
jgi:protein TonB